MQHPSLRGALLQFDRTGQYLAVGERDRVLVVSMSGPTRQLAIGSPIRALAPFGDQLWVLGDALRRFDLDGRPLGEPCELVADAWDVAPCGPPGVIAGSIGIIEDLGTLSSSSHPDADTLVPLTARRVLAVNGARVVLPSGLVAILPPNHRVLSGLVLADGKSAVLAVAHVHGRSLVVISLGTGQLVSRHDIEVGETRVACQRAVAIVRVDTRQIDVIDLRAGRALGTFVTQHDIDDFAIDPDGRRIAIRSGDDVELLDLGEQLRAVAHEAARANAVNDNEDVITSAKPTPAEVVVAGAVARAPITIVDDPNDVVALSDHPLLALAPRRAGPRLDRAQALACLDVERDVILARGLCGIATGWDSRRLGYANESSHPFELEVAALLGTSRGHAEGHVAAARERLADADRRRRADREQHFEASPLADLAHELGLTPLDADILVAIAAPTLWGETARLYAVLANDTGRGVVDEMLVTQLLGDVDRYEIAAALGPDATLRRYGLVRVVGERPRPFTHLEIDPIVAARLCGEPMPLPEAIEIREASRSLEQLLVPREPLSRILGELGVAKPRVRLAVRGRRGSGRRSVLAAIAARAGRALGVIDLGQLAELGMLRALLREASLCGLVPCTIGSIADDSQATARAIRDVIAGHPGPVFAALGTDEQSPFALGHLEFVLPTLSATDRLEHWRVVLARHDLCVADPEALSSRYRLTPGMVERAAATVAASTEHTDDTTRDLEAAIRQGRDDRLARLATRVTRLPRWSDVVLPPDVLDSLRELIGRVQYGRRVYEEWGFDAVMTTGRGLTALFDGRPGTGKTMVAGIIARELGLDLYRVDVSRLVSKWIGETEKNLAEIFDAVDDGQAIILFDEADSLFAKRTEVKSSNDRYANLEVNYLLQRIDSFDGIAVLTTNFGSAIDPAFRRRVSFRLSFPFPDEEAREQLWRVHLPARMPIAGELDLGALARRFQLAGGYIRNACLRAAFLAAQEETTLAQRHLERAVQLEYQQVGKISTSGPVE
jgi:hypothetical protein